MIFDGSSDNLTLEIVESYKSTSRGKKYELIYYRTPSGMTKQRNIAINYTDAEISVFLDDDVTLEPTYLDEIEKVFTNDFSNEIVGINGFDKNGYSGLGLRQKFFRTIGLLPQAGAAQYLPWGHSTPHTETGSFDGIRDCDVLIGHDMAWRTNILKELRFDSFFEQYPTYVLYDDQDISLRARRKYRLVQCGSAHLFHLVSPNSRPPGFHYGFQTIFNAYRNWKVHCPNKNFLNHSKFWLWELLNAFFMLITCIWRPYLLEALKGRLAGAQACFRNIEDYETWKARGINRNS